MFGKMESFFTRHSKKPKGEDKESAEYPGISESGVELAKERAKSLLEMAEKSEPGSVIFIGGASEQVRTKSTAEVYGDELDELTKDRQDEFLVITRKMIGEMAHGSADKLGFSELVGEIKKLIDYNKDKKIVIDFPLFLKEFAMGGDGRWADRKGNLNEYIKSLLARNGNDELKALREWITTKGTGNNGPSGPSPEEIAASQLAGFVRLKEFASKHAPNRPIVIGMIGHSWNLDTLSIYLANDGRIDLDGFKEVGDSIIKETEVAQISINGEKGKLKYRSKEYAF